MSFVRYYDYFLNDLSDPRVKEWSLVTTPWPTLSIIALYLSLVYVFVPAFMKNRKAYELKTFIKYYNIFQIVYCAVIIWGVATSGWLTEYKWTCQPVDYSNRPIAIRMLNFVYWTYILKGIELIETILFLLRKKNNQVSNLHVYHHSSTFFLAWIGVRYIGGGMATFPIMLNSFIHILMYMYYLLSSFGPEWQKKLAPWKPRLTMAQMVQFCILIGHSLFSLDSKCDVPKQVLLLYIPNVVVIFYMFADFYKQNYSKKEKSKQA